MSRLQSSSHRETWGSWGLAGDSQQHSTSAPTPVVVAEHVNARIFTVRQQQWYGRRHARHHVHHCSSTICSGIYVIHTIRRYGAKHAHKTNATNGEYPGNSECRQAGHTRERRETENRRAIRQKIMPRQWNGEWALATTIHRSGCARGAVVTARGGMPPCRSRRSATPSKLETRVTTNPKCRSVIILRMCRRYGAAWKASSCGKR